MGVIQDQFQAQYTFEQYSALEQSKNRPISFSGDSIPEHRLRVLTLAYLGFLLTAHRATKPEGAEEDTPLVLPTKLLLQQYEIIHSSIQQQFNVSTRHSDDTPPPDNAPNPIDSLEKDFDEAYQSLHQTLSKKVKSAINFHVSTRTKRSFLFSAFFLCCTFICGAAFAMYASNTLHLNGGIPLAFAFLAAATLLYISLRNMILPRAYSADDFISKISDEAGVLTRPFLEIKDDAIFAVKQNALYKAVGKWTLKPKSQQFPDVFSSAVQEVSLKRHVLTHVYTQYDDYKKQQGLLEPSLITSSPSLICYRTSLTPLQELTSAAPRLETAEVDVHALARKLSVV